MIDIEILNRLNAPTRAERLANLKALLGEAKFPPAVPEYINNHIHTTYSFSPYSPTAAVYAARMEGLCTAGIIDHDSIAGAREFIAAAECGARGIVAAVFEPFKSFVNFHCGVSAANITYYPAHKLPDVIKPPMRINLNFPRFWS